MSFSPSSSSSSSLDPSISFDPSFSSSLDPSFSYSPSSSSSSSSSSSPSASLDPSYSASPSYSSSVSPSASSSSSSSSSLSPSSSPSSSPEPEYVYEPPPLDIGAPSYSFSPSDFSNGTSVGYSVALKKDVPFDFQFRDKFDNVISNDFDLINSYTNVKVGFDVYTTGDVLAPSGANFRTGLVTTNYIFTRDQNSGAFGGVPQRYYKLKFSLQEESLTNYLDYTIYHMPAEITGASVSGYSEGQTGAVTITVNTPKNGSFFTVRQFDLYTGSSTGFSPNTGNLMKNFPIFGNRTSYELNILKNEQPKGQPLYYKILPYDDFSTGYFYTGAISGTLDYPIEPRTFLEAVPVRGSFQDRTGVFTGLASPTLTEYDGLAFYQTGVGQDFYIVKSGQWKTVQLA